MPQQGLANTATNAFLYSLAGGCRVVGAVTIVGAVVAIGFLPARPRQNAEAAAQEPAVPLPPAEVALAHEAVSRP